MSQAVFPLPLQPGPRCSCRPARYRQVETELFGLKHAATFSVPLSSWKERCDILTGTLGKNVTVYFINKDIYFDRPGLYGTPKGDYSDNAERFIFSHAPSRSSAAF